MIAACELPKGSLWERIRQAVARELLSQAQRKNGSHAARELPSAAKAMLA